MSNLRRQIDALDRALEANPTPLHPSGFRHTTLDRYPDRVAGITLVDEKPGFTGIYLRDPQGGLWPARTVSRRAEGGKHHDSVIDAWLSREGEHVDLRAKKGEKRRTRRARPSYGVGVLVFPKGGTKRGIINEKGIPGYWYVTWEDEQRTLESERDIVPLE